MRTPIRFAFRFKRTVKKHKTFIMVGQLHPLKQTVQCLCGKVEIAIDAKDVLRLVCYCKDCRGFYNTIHTLADACDHAKLAATTTTTPYPVVASHLDPWGGCDYTHLFPDEMNVVAGKEHVRVVKIRDKSVIHRFYTTCCYTPLFRVGPSKTVLLNTNLIDDANKAEVRFRIVGRDALVNKAAATTPETRPPPMSWSVPFSWFWIMMGRSCPDKAAATSPVEVPDKVSVLENFQQG
jgi:hypothetical protein